MPRMTFIGRDGVPKDVDAPVGESLLQIAHENDVDIEGVCEGSLACATCHVIVGEQWFDQFPEPTDEEEDMLDLAVGLERTSRLGCQLIMTEALDGLTVKLGPEG